MGFIFRHFNVASNGYLPDGSLKLMSEFCDACISATQDMASVVEQEPISTFIQSRTPTHSRRHRRQDMPVVERVVLRDEDMSGWQDFFNHTSAGIVAKHFFSRVNQSLLGEFLNVFRRESGFPHGGPHPGIDDIPQADQRHSFVVIFHCFHNQSISYSWMTFNTVFSV
jgi:hypothetical protein